MDFQNLRNVLFIGSISLSLASSVGVVFGNKYVRSAGFSGLGGGLSTLVVLEVVSGALNRQSKKVIDENQKLLEDKEQNIKDKQGSIQKLELAIKQEKLKLDQVNFTNNELTQKFTSSQYQLKIKSEELAEANAEIHKLKLDIKNIGAFTSSESHRIVRDTYNRQVKKVECLLNALIRNYSDYENQFEKILQEFDGFKFKFLKQVEEYESINTFEDLLDIGLELQEKIIDKSVELRCKAQSIIIKDFQKILDSAVNVDEVENIVSALTIEAKNQIEELKSNWVADRKAIASEWAVSNNSMVDKYQTEFNTNLEIAKEAVTKMERLEDQLSQLKQQLTEAKKPQLFYGISIPANAGNSISKHYYDNYGYKLDCITWNETITGYELIFGIRSNPGLSENDLFVDNSKEKIAAFTNSYPGTDPKLEFNRQDNTLIFKVKLRNEVKEVLTPQQQVEKLKLELESPDRLIEFINASYHVGLWAETGGGKTTLISNIIGGMHQVLEGKPTIRTTIPKIDEDTAKIFPEVDWLGIPNSIFGLLEAALEIQFRIHKNENAYLNKKPFPKFAPIIFFIDEINAIFGRWHRIVEADLEDVLSRFKQTLELGSERLEYFERYMELELRNYKNEFAKRLLLFTWQTGRSLNVKSLIAGQNLMPGQFRITKNDLANCSYIALGDAVASATDYKVKSTFKDEINLVKQRIDEGRATDPNLKYVGLYCPQGKPYFGILPEPNYYKWGDSPQESNNSNCKDKEIYFAVATNTTDSALDSISNNMECRTENLDLAWTGSPIVKTVQRPTGKVWSKIDFLHKPFKNLDYKGVLDLYVKLPKKDDGSVHKTKAYSQIFKVSNSSLRKIYSEFIDYLEAEFRL